MAHLILFQHLCIIIKFSIAGGFFDLGHIEIVQPHHLRFVHSAVSSITDRSVMTESSISSSSVGSATLSSFSFIADLGNTVVNFKRTFHRCALFLSLMGPFLLTSHLSVVSRECVTKRTDQIVGLWRKGRVMVCVHCHLLGLASKIHLSRHDSTTW